jgi:hypothetical protein
MRVLAPVLPEQQPVKGALVVAVRRGRVPVDVMRLTAHAAVLVGQQRNVYARAANLGILGEKVFGGVRIALGVVMRGRLIKQQRVDAVAVPAFDVVKRSHAVALFVPGVSIAVVAITALLASLCVVLPPLAVLYVSSKVKRVAQFDAEVAVLRAALQLEVWSAWVSDEVERGNLAACGVVLLSDYPADAGGYAGLARGAVLRGDGYDGQLLERVGFGVVPECVEKRKSWRGRGRWTYSCSPCQNK